MKFKIIIFLAISIVLQILILPTLCDSGSNEAMFYVAIAIDILILLRLLYKSNKTDINLYFTILLTSFIWIHFFIYALVMLIDKYE